MAEDRSDTGIKTSTDHWNAQYTALPSTRFWSPFDPNITDVRRLLAKHVRPGSSFLEFGCAPGKYLGMVASKLGAHVAGVDYSPRGIDIARKFFVKLGLEADLRCEDMDETSFRADSLTPSSALV